MRIRNVLVRRLLPLEAIDAAVAEYEALFGEPARLRFDYPEMELRLVQVGQILFIGGSDAALAPFRATAMTFMVDDIAAFAAYLPPTGATILDGIRHVPTGRNMLVRQRDGALVEYVEHDSPHAADAVLVHAVDPARGAG